MSDLKRLEVGQRVIAAVDLEEWDADDVEDGEVWVLDRDPAFTPAGTFGQITSYDEVTDYYTAAFTDGNTWVVRWEGDSDESDIIPVNEV